MEIRSLVKIILLALCCLIIHVITTHGQTLYSTGATITVAPNTTLTINGSVENAGTIANDGELKVAGPWINSGVYHPGQGRVTFNSTSATVPQIIHHNGQTFNRVTVAGGTKKIILSDMTIGEEIRFDSGIVEVAGASKITFAQDVDIYGASDQSHIHGPVFQVGTGHKLFPTGNGRLYLPVELTTVTDPLAVIGVQGFEFANLSLTSDEPLNAISDERYWHISVVSGTLDNSQVVLPLRRESWISDPSKVVVVQSATPSENFSSIGQSRLDGDGEERRVTSAARVSMPFVALATAGAELVVYNAVSPNGDQRNDYLRIENIENYMPNKFSLFNRWGDKVFEIENYNNEDRRFTGSSNLHGNRELTSGTYFYVLDLPAGESLRGFIVLKR